MRKFIDMLRANGRSENTIKSYTADIKKFLEWLGADSLNQTSLTNYKNHLKECQATVNTINRKMIVVKKYIEFATNDKLEYKPIKQERQIDFMTMSDYERVMRQAVKADDTLIITLMETLLYTGLRISEVLNMRLEDVKSGLVTVENKGRYREVPLINRVKKMLKKYIKETERASNLVFETTRGNQYDQAYLYKKLQRYTGLARVKKSRVHAHGFRHLFAKRFLELDGTNLAELSRILGHSDVNTTAIYAQKNIRESKNAMEQWG